MVQSLVVALHRARCEAAEQILLRECSDRLSCIDLTDPNEWAIEFESILESLSNLPDVTSIELYSRKKARFERLVPHILDVPTSFRTRDIIDRFPVSHLVPPSITSSISLTNEKINETCGWYGYRSQTGWGAEVTSTLLRITGNIREADYKFWVMLAGNICRVTDSAVLIFRERDADEQYRRQVRRIGHSFRTPLLAIELLLNRIESEKDPGPLVDQILNRVQDTSDDLHLLLDTHQAEVSTFDLVELLEEVLETVEPIARNHPCSIERSGDWSNAIVVKGVRYFVQRAFVALADNAIKYSYSGMMCEGGLFKVQVRLESHSQHVFTVFSNYGIGIPEADLERVKEYEYRSEISDQKKLRSGTGTGLPFANEVFTDAGGWLFIESRPAKQSDGEALQDYHRYLTVVEAALPIQLGQ